jgi:multiple sugar transport system ATP-binding protein
MALVSLERVRKVFDNGQVAVADATLDIADGELVVLVGPSGCGKSTLLRMVAGLETITSGTIRIGGQVVNDVAPKLRDIAMVFQSYALYPHMTVEENLAFGLRLRGVSAGTIRERVSAAAAFLGLEQLLDRRPRQLSGGQRQRVALGRALVRQPQVFLLDEPLSNLDARLRLAMRTEIARLHRRLAATMIYVTHDQVEAMTLGQRIVVLNAGEIQQVDTPMRIYERPANVFVSTFLGSPAMNLFRGRCTADPQPRLVADGLALDLAPEFARRVRAAAGSGGLVVGLRPEHLQAGTKASAGTGQFSLQGVVEVIEQLGNEAIVTSRCGTHEVVSRVAPRGLPEPGSPIMLTYSPANLHYFRADTGERIPMDGSDERENGDTGQ